MDWIPLTQLSQLAEISERSQNESVLIFKHSNRCSISGIAKNRLESGQFDNTPFYYLDLITYRDISNEIAERFKVYHESPQILLIRYNECVYEESHGGITVDEIQDQLSQNV